MGIGTGSGTEIGEAFKRTNGNQNHGGRGEASAGQLLPIILSALDRPGSARIGPDRPVPALSSFGRVSSKRAFLLCQARSQGQIGQPSESEI